MPNEPHPTPRPVFTSGEAYADWINQRIGKKVTQLREGLGMTPYALGLKCGVSDQTILNVERNKCDRGALTGTLARIAFFFGITLEALIESAGQS